MIVSSYKAHKALIQYFNVKKDLKKAAIDLSKIYQLVLFQRMISFISRNGKLWSIPSSSQSSKMFEHWAMEKRMWYEKTWRNIKAFARWKEEVLKFLLGALKIYFFGPSSRLIVTILT